MTITALTYILEHLTECDDEGQNLLDALKSLHTFDLRDTLVWLIDHSGDLVETLRSLKANLADHEVQSGADQRLISYIQKRHNRR